ncbi:hypothetical protein TW65_01291 [Stemphylium lycopersici]|uniref:Fungal specific transcription factor n=1 Tax=Stemphylium lycopersici TaxID=183478 RepID=A0A364N198_STELY|nr:hypothetical protein TW65_01291 [Stemphylium lycopersici]RAR09400.1 fungal specific transcription factor [Stemphylium lycopersici]
MSSLNEALEDLGRLRVRTEALNVEFDLSPAESRACIDRFADVMINMVIPDTFASTLIDVSLLKALPEVINSPTCGEEDDRDALRYFYWHTLSVDVLFRLFYGKPRLLRLSGKVRPPLIFRANNMHPSAMNVTVSVVWVRYNTLTDNMVTYIENHASEGREDDLRKKTDECCKELEHIIAEWKLEQLMRSNETRDDHRCMLADHIMNVYANIIGIQRLAQTAVQRNSVQTVEPSSYSLRAARKVSNIILEFHTHPTLNFKAKSITNHCPDDCESDIQLLENLGLAMDQAVDAGLTVQGINMPPTSFDAIQNMVATELPDFDMSTVSVPEYPADVGSDFQSLGFFRALENDFVARNWQNDWWDLSGGVDADMGQMPGRY